jgi:hypothetical protein
MVSLRTQEANMLVQYGMSLKGNDVTPDTATAFLATFINNGQDNIQAVQKLDHDIISIDREIQTLQHLGLERKGSTDGDVTIALHSKVATTAELRLAYRTCSQAPSPSF